MSPEHDIFIVHLHPTTPEASDEDFEALQSIYRALAIGSNRRRNASLLIIGAGDKEEILHTFDSAGRYMTINLEDLLVKEMLSQHFLDKLFLLKYKGDRSYKAADSYKPIWYADSELYPNEIPGIGLLLPGYLNSAPLTVSIPDQAELVEPQPNLSVVHNTGEIGKWPIIYVERKGLIQPLEQKCKGQQYCYILNGIPYFAGPNSLFPNSGTKINIPSGGIKIADYQINLTGGTNIHNVDIVAVPKVSLPKQAK